MLSGDNGVLKKASEAKKTTEIAQIEETLKLEYNNAVMEKVTSGNGSKVSTMDWTFKMIDDGMTVIIEETDNENEYIVTIDEDDNLYIFNTSTQKLTKYEKEFTADWYKEYKYDLDSTAKTISLTKYIGTDKIAYVGKSAKIDGGEYTTVLQGKKESGNITDTIFGGTIATKVKLQSGITEIGEGAFYNNSNLKSIILPNGITTIENGAFSGDLANVGIVYIPSSVSSIGSGAFSGNSGQGCQNLKTVIVGAREITDGAFASCNQIEGIKFLEGVETVTNGALAFYSSKNESLKKLEFPKGIRTISNGSFSNCSTLETIVIPNGADFVGNSAFSNCNGVKEIVCGAKEITNGAFGGFTKLEKLELLNGVETISGGACSGLTSLKSIKFPDNIKEITNGAFGSCTSLTEITIPNRIEKIDLGCFSLSSLLKTTIYTTSSVAKNYNWVAMNRNVTFKRVSKVQVGDYVDYDPTKSDAKKTQNVDSNKLKYESSVGTGKSHGNGYGTQTFEATSEMKWRVLSVSDNKVELISETVVKKKENADSGNFVLKGAIGYLYAEQELNEVCKIYGYGYGADLNSGGSYEVGGPKDTPVTGKIEGTGARSITAEDINKLAGLTTEESLKTLASNYGNTTSPTSDVFYPTTSTENGQSDSAGAKNLKYTFYYYNGKSKITNEDIQNILFNGNYWFASRCVETAFNSAIFFVRYIYDASLSGYSAYNGLESEPFEGAGNFCAIRPIVTLDANVIDVSNVTDTSGESSNPWKLK